MAYSGNPYVDEIVAGGYKDDEGYEPEWFDGDETDNSAVYDYCTTLQDNCWIDGSDGCEHCWFTDGENDFKCPFETYPFNWGDDYFA